MAPLTIAGVQAFLPLRSATPAGVGCRGRHLHVQRHLHATEPPVGVHAHTSITTNASASPESSLRGTGIPVRSQALHLLRRRLNFGSQQVNTAARRSRSYCRMWVRRPSTLIVVGITGDFTQTNNCGPSLPPNGNCTITVRFSPTLLGGRSGLLTVSTAAGTVDGAACRQRHRSTGGQSVRAHHQRVAAQRERATSTARQRRHGRHLRPAGAASMRSSARPCRSPCPRPGRRRPIPRTGLRVAADEAATPMQMTHRINTRRCACLRRSRATPTRGCVRGPNRCSTSCGVSHRRCTRSWRCGSRETSPTSRSASPTSGSRSWALGSCPWRS